MRMCADTACDTACVQTVASTACLKCICACVQTRHVCRHGMCAKLGVHPAASVAKACLPPRFTTSLVQEPAFLNSMSASALHDIVGEGDENTWKKLTEHEHSFLFAAVVDQAQVTSLHELVWCRAKPRARATGATGWVTCRQNSAAGESLGLTHSFRVHVCRQWPCTAVYHPAKYGAVPPPARHGKIVRLCERGEIVSMESAWSSLLKDIEGASAVAEAVAEASDAPLPTTLVDAMSEPASAVTERAPRGSKRKLSGDAKVFQDEVVSAANVVGARAENEQGVTSALDAPLPGTVVEAMSEPTSAVAQRVSEPTSAVAEKSSDAETIRTLIMARADEISVAGAWIGVFEIMAFCAMYKQRVVVQLEEGTVDPIADLAPRLIDKTWNMQPFPGRLVVCRMVSSIRGGGVWHTACWKTCTHYVAAQPLQHELPLHGSGVVAHMARLGYATIMTEANGDCCIEALLVLANSRRGPMERTSLRRRLQEFMQAAACSSVWQDAYLAAGEVLPEKRIRVGEATASGNEEAAPQGRKADIRGGGDPCKPPAMTKVESTNPCNPPASAAGPIVMADTANPALRAAILWSVGLERPTDSFLRRITASLTADEGEQLVQAHKREGGARVVPRKTNKPPLLSIGKKSRRAVSLSYKQALAKAYTQWAAERNVQVLGCPSSGKRTHGAMTQFLKESADGLMTRAEQHKQLMFLRRSLRQLNARQVVPSLVKEPAQKRCKRFSQRCRVKSFAGRPVKAGLVREELYDWFCLIKRSVRGRIPTAFMLQKASTLVEEYVAACLRQGIQAKAPVISYHWLRLWRLEYGVSFRKPNRKWKVAGAVLAERLRITWENVYRVRQLAIRVLGYDLDQDNLDQSPFHMNEAGSKAEKSMSIRGCGVVPLKEGHAQTRERWTLQTHTTSNADRARQVPPVEIMFKADGDRVQAKVSAAVPAWAPWLTVVTGAKGSYREDDVLNYIEHRLEPMTDGRRWRILLLDAYSAHLSERVRVCAWQRGYVVVTHGGGASAVTQTNDTDLHAHIKRMYLDLEMADAVEQMKVKPWGVPCPRREDIVGWVSCIWSSQELHLRATRGFLKVGLANALDGSEDAEICREAGQFWHQEGMRQRRAEVVHDVNVEVDAKRLAWRYEDVYSVINPFPLTRGGGENEPADKGSSSSEDGDADEDIDSDPGEDLDAALDQDALTRGGGEIVAHAEQGSMPADTDGVLQASRARLQSMQVVLKQVRAIGNLSLESQVEKAIHIEEKRVRILAREHPEVSKSFFLEQEAEQMQMRKDQASIRKAFANDKERRVAIKDLLAQQDKLRERKLELLRASTLVECEKALKSWDLDDLGQGHPSGGTRAHAKNRMAILERVRARAKPLPPDLANDWAWFLKHWDAARVNMLHPWQKDGWAGDFLKIAKDLLSKLSDDPDALATWMRREIRISLAAPALRI